jgi:hypothetical protein
MERSQVIRELLYKEELAGEIRVHRIAIFVSIVILGLLSVFLVTVYEDFVEYSILNYGTVLVYLAYHALALRLNRNGLYHPSVKYVTTILNIASLTMAVLLVNREFVIVLRGIVLYLYVLPIVVSGFYYRPAMPLVAGALTSVLQVVLFAYGLAVKRSRWDASRGSMVRMRRLTSS